MMRLPYPVRNVLQRWRGMLGMIVGVGIALSVVMTMLAVSAAQLAIYTSDFMRSGTDLYVTTQGGTLIPVLPGDTPGTIKHARNVLSQIRSLPGANAAIGVMTWTMEREREGPRHRDEPTELIATMGVDGDPTLIPEMLVLRQGRWLRRSDEIVLGARLSREKGLTLGNTLRLNGRDFTVVGIGRLRGVGFATDSLAFMDGDAFRQRATVGDVVNIIAIDTTQPDLDRQRIAEIDSLAVASPPELVRQAEAVEQTAVVIRWIFNGLSLTVGALFVANMLGRSVAERRLEFATLRAIGVPTRTIMLLVGMEALVVSVVAAAVGIGLSLLLGAWMDATVAPEYGFETLYVVDLNLVIVVVGLSLGLGMLSGLVPARQATSVDPVEILREA
jgi:putative ABC transport system permease protein